MFIRRTLGEQEKKESENKKTVQNQRKVLGISIPLVKVSKKYDFLIFGATGLQGRIVARFLVEKGYKVILSDKTKELNAKVDKRCKETPFFEVDIEEVTVAELSRIIKKISAHVVINCVSAFLNWRIFEASINAKTHYIDLGSYGETIAKQISMHNVLQEKGLIAITGCGSVPGIGNVMLRYAAEKFDTLETIEAGFAWDSNIKKFVIPFSMEAIFYEFVNPAEAFENGEIVYKMPLENKEKRFFTGIGKQIIIPITHSEAYTFHHYFKQRGLKNIRFFGGFPKHSMKRILALIELGFHSEEKINIHGKPTYIVDLTAEVLRKLKHPAGYREKENLWVSVEGIKDGKTKKILMECLVPTIEGWEDAGCNIDTGIPAAIIAEMIRKGVINQPGSYAPEAVVPPEEFFAAIKEKELLVYENKEAINGKMNIPLQNPSISKKKILLKKLQQEQ